MAKMFYSTEETVEKLGVDPSRLKELIEQNRLREFRDGQRVMFKVDQVDRLSGELKGGTGTTSAGPIDLAPSASGSPLSMASEGSSAGLSPADSKMGSKSGTGFGAPGKSGSGSSPFSSKAGEKAPPIKVFDINEIKPSDASAQTQISSALDESISPSGLDSVGSGSGLLDLTRESDNTSLGAELLEEIYPGDGGSGASQSGVGSASGIFDQSAGSKAGETGLGSALPINESAPVAVASSYAPMIEAPDPMSGLFGGLALAAVLAMLLSFITVAASIDDFVPSFVRTLGGNLLMLVGLLVLVTALVAIAGLFAGRAGDR